MTAEQVDMATPDSLQLLDNDAVDSFFTPIPLQREDSDSDQILDNQTDDDFSPPPDYHPDPTSECSGSMPFPCQDKTMEIDSPKIQKEKKFENADLVLMRPSDHTVLLDMTRNHLNKNKVNCDFDTVAVKETDNISNKYSNLDLQHQTSQSLMDVDNMTDRNQNDANINAVPDEADGRPFASPEVPLSQFSYSPTLIEHQRPAEQDKMSTDFTFDQNISSKSLGHQISQMGNDVELPLINKDIKNAEQSPDQPCSITENATDTYFSLGFLSLACQNLLKDVDFSVHGAAAYNTYPEMHNIAIGTTSKTPDLYETDTLNILTDLKNPSSLFDSVEMTSNVQTSCITKIDDSEIDSPLLDSLEMTNMVLETAEVPVKDCDFAQTLNKTSEDKIATLNVGSCTSVLTQTDQNLVESEYHRIDESIVDVTFDAKSSIELNRVQQVADCSNDPPLDNTTKENSDTLALICSLQRTLMETPEISEQDEKNLSQMTPRQTHVHTGDLSDCYGDNKGVDLKFAETKRDGESCDKLRLDDFQFLAGEVDEGAIFDKWGRSPSPRPPTAQPANTKASDFSRRENISIDHHTLDRELWFPPVERWSSSDSWASALSDWFQTVNTYTEDCFTSTSTSNTGSELSMAIQDTTLEQKTSPDIANNTGQACLSLNLQEPEAGIALGRGLADKTDKTNGNLFKRGDKDCLPSQSDSGRQNNATMEKKVNLSENLVESDSLNKPEMNAVVDTFNSTPCVCTKNQFSIKQYESQDISGELWSAKTERNALLEVTGHRVSQLGLDFEDYHESNFGSPKISAYTGNKNLKTECVSAERCGYIRDCHTCPSQSNIHVSLEAGHLKQTHVVETDEKFFEGNGSDLCSNTEDFSVKPGEGSSTIPQFVMPFAPLGIGSTFLHNSVLKDGPKADLDLPLKGISNDPEISSIEQGQKSISSADSSEDQFHNSQDQSLTSSFGDSEDPSIKDSRRKTENTDTCDISKELSKLLLLTGECFMVSENKRVAYVTLDLDEPRDFTFSQSLLSFSNHANMTHKTSKASLDVKTRSKHKEKSADQQHENQTKIKDNLYLQSQAKSEFNSEKAGCEGRAVTVIETIVITEKITPKTQVKKKKKHTQLGTAKHENDLPTEVGSRTTQESANGKTENTDVKQASNGLDKPASHLPTSIDLANTDSKQKVMPVRPKVATSLNIVAKMGPVGIDTNQNAIPVKLKADASGSNVAKMENKTCGADPQRTHLLNDDIKRRRIANDLSGAVPIKTRPQLPAIFRQARKDGQDTTKRSYSEVVKQKTPPPKEVVVPRVVSEIQADPVPDDPQNISLWCRVSPVLPDVTIKWTKEGSVLSESRKGEGDSDRFTLTIKKACSKDLGLYKCSMTTSDISVSTAEYHLTSEVLMELVIPSHDQPAEPRIVDGEEESVQCSPLLFKEDFLSDQYFGENQTASILTEKVHFGEGMHRKAFRTMLRAGKLPRFNPGHPCVLKVHNAIGYGTKNTEELVHKNYSLAVEECHVQNTAREYIKAYNSVAKTAESFGEVPEIIPIYLVHRPSNDIPYATLEEELLGDFVKYSVKDGKEINLMRRDSEAGQKCCAFQHWVYTQTEGNLLVTDMQGVGMKLTDVGIATCKKGYKGFRGNCATSFIDQFKALHQCNRYCELLGLTSLQPKPKRTFVSAKPKAQPVPKKKTFGPVLKGKS